MTLSVIGAGFGRTATKSLKLALERLGFGPCYHMMEVRNHPHHDRLWLDALQGRAVDWDALFSGYRSACDWPQCHFWRELMSHYPEAKVILTLRDAERWYQSISNTIFPHVAADPDPGDAQAVLHRTMTRTLIQQQTFGGRWQEREHVLSVYRHHIETVRREVPADRLLVFDAVQGWEPLCDFLGVALPEEGYPRVNSTQEFQDRADARR
jgi:hypothetical protein